MYGRQAVIDKNSSVTVQIIVRPNEVDPYQIAHHASYLVWVEQALRQLLSESMDIVPSYLITQFECKYKESAKVDDRLILFLRLKKIISDFEYDFLFSIRLDKNKRELTNGHLVVKL